MKKLSIFLSVIMMAAVSACTLYMDEPEEEGRILRTGEGYDQPETITLPDDQGTVTYEYSQKTIPINDEVEQYIVKVESDTILYFEGGTPEEYLPEVGEMMTCSFRDRFPHAFCHKCIDRTENDGIYRCVFKKCPLKEAFKVMNFKVSPKIDYESVNGTPITIEEFDSLMSEQSDLEGGESTASSRSESNTEDKFTRSWFNTGKREFKGIKTGKINVSLKPNLKNFAGVAITGSLGITLGGYFEMEYDGDKDVTYTEVGIMGSLDTQLAVNANAGIFFQSPVAIPLVGFKADLWVAGVDIGLTVNPYFDVRKEVSADVSCSFGFDLGFGYAQVGNQEGKWDKKKHKLKTKRGYPALRITPRDWDANAKNINLHIKSGWDWHFGVGADVFGTGFDFAVGLDVYRDFQIDMDMGEYHSAADFKKKYADLPSKAVIYAEGSLKAAQVGIPVRVETDPWSCGTSKIPILPEYKEGSAYFYCSDFNPPYTYKMKAELEDIGLMGWFWNWTPKMRIYFDGDELEKSKPVQTFDMKCKEGSDMRVLEATKRSNEIITNIPYIAQAAMVETLPGGRSFTVPLVDIPFNVEIPDMVIDEDRLRASQTLTPQNATPQELANPSIIATKNGKAGWIKNGRVYNYRYKIDVPVTIEAPRLIREWGIHMGDNYANSNEFSHKEKSKKEYLERVVRMTWYSSESSLSLYFYPFAYVQDSEGHKSGKKNYETCNYTVQYSKMLDQQYSITGGNNADYEKSRTLIPEVWRMHSTDLPWGEGAVLGDIELISDDDEE